MVVVFFAVAGTRNSIRKEDRSKTNSEMRKRRRRRWRRRGYSEETRGKEREEKADQGRRKKRKRDQRIEKDERLTRGIHQNRLKSSNLPPFMGLAHRNCNHLTFISMRFSRNHFLFFLFFLNKNASTLPLRCASSYHGDYYFRTCKKIENWEVEFDRLFWNSRIRYFEILKSVFVLCSTPHTHTHARVGAIPSDRDSDCEADSRQVYPRDSSWLVRSSKFHVEVSRTVN